MYYSGSACKLQDLHCSFIIHWLMLLRIHIYFLCEDPCVDGRCGRACTDFLFSQTVGRAVLPPFVPRWGKFHIKRGKIMAKDKMKNCATCGQLIAANCKACPHCGAKNKKPFYKKWWLWVIVAIVIVAIAGGSGDTTADANTKQLETTVQNEEQGTEQKTAKDTEEPKTEEPKTEEPQVPQEYKNALAKAESYSSMMHMSKQGIYDQLTSEYGEKFPADAAQYAIDHLDADYKENALEKAKSYYEDMNMSKDAVRNQLISEYGEKFTAEEADYAIANLK